MLLILGQLHDEASYLISGMYILFATVLSSVELVFVVAVLNYQYNTNDYLFPTWICRFIVGPVASCLRVRVKKNVSIDLDDNNRPNNINVVESDVAHHPDMKNTIYFIDPKDIAKVLDRAFFCLFLLVTTGIIVTLILVCHLDSDGTDRPRTGYGYTYKPNDL